jgi:hypothetical protein
MTSREEGVSRWARSGHAARPIKRRGRTARAARGKGSAHEAVELGRRLTALETEQPPGDFSTHVLEVLHMPARAAQRLMAQSRESQGAESVRHPRGHRGRLTTRVQSDALWAGACRVLRGMPGTHTAGISARPEGVRMSRSRFGTRQSRQDPLRLPLAFSLPDPRIRGDA